MVRAILSACPEALTRKDREGKTPLHYAAAARGSGAVYDTLLEYGADESVLDKKGKTPSYYVNNIKEIDQKLCVVIPEAPRTATIFPANWDWRQLRLDWLGKSTSHPPPTAPVSLQPNNGDSAFEDETPEKSSPPGSEINNRAEIEELTRPQTYDIDADEGVEDEEEKETGYAADSDEQEGHYEAEYAEVEPDYEVTNEPTARVQNLPTNPESESEQTEEGEEEQQNEDEKEKEDGKKKENHPDGKSGLGVEELQRIVDIGNMEQLADVVLAGDGEALAKFTSTNPDVQFFIDNIPNYLRKIEKVHSATKEGNLRELQAVLDRRKFAIARECKSHLRLSPLHVAVLYGRTAIVRFLAGRFPETMKVRDTKGRTPLHYAATLPDNGHYYNLLLGLGADTSIEDSEAKTAEYYLQHPDYLTHQQLLAEFEGRKIPENSNNSEKGLAEGAIAISGFPVFGQEDGQYLAASLGRPLIAGLTEVASKRPQDPVKYLANYLYTYDDNPEHSQPKELEQNYSEEKENTLQAPPPPPSPPQPQHVEAKITEIGAKGEVEEEEEIKRKTPEPPTSAFKPVQRDEFGQMILHFAMARTHGRNAVLQMLQEIDCNIAMRDELYRTPRDVAAQVNIVDNVEAIDKYVVSLAATGQIEKLRELLLEGYDHILDAHDEQASIVEVANERGQTAVLAFLDSINSFEDRRERLHRAIRLASDSQVHEILRQNPGLALAKNTYARCSLHIAVLNQHDHIVQHIANNYPQTLAIGDNLLRTALHYAMGVERVESLSRILIQAGAARVVKDLKGRQPSYYFMNKSDIQKLQDEEDMLRV